MSLPTIVFLAPAGVCALSWFGLGRAIPRRFLPDDALLRVLTRVAVGSTAFALGTYALGRAHAYWRPLLIALTVLFALVALPSLRRLPRILPAARAEGVVATLIALALAFDLVAASVPPTSADALKYHLALPKLWLQSGAVGDAFWAWISFDPFGIEMLFGQGLAIGGGPTASAVGAVLAVLAAAAVYGLGRELGGGRSAAGLAAAGLFVLQGVFTWSATSVFVELGLTFYIVLALWYAVRFYRLRAGRDLVWAGITAGAAAGTKYVGLQAWLLVIPLVLLGLRRVHVRALGAALALAAVAGGGWYLKNALVAGNAIYPLHGGGKWWTPDSQRELDALGHAYGVGHSPVRLVLLPFELLRHGAAFDRGQYVGTAIFVAALLALVVVRRTETVVLFASASMFTVSWWYLSPQARFLLPALAIFAALGGAAVAALPRDGLARLVVGLGVLAVAADWAAPSFALTRRAFPVAVGATSRSAYLERETGTYDAIVDASHRARGTLGLIGYPFSYNVPRRAIALTTAEFAPDVPTRVFRGRLRSEGVLYLFEEAGSLGQYPQLRGCVAPVKRYEARLVISRSLGTSVPQAFRLFHLRRSCV
jgi:hypothetical protein